MLRGCPIPVAQSDLMLDASPRDKPKVLLFEGEELASRSKTEMISPIPPCAVRHRQTVYLVAVAVISVTKALSHPAPSQLLAALDLRVGSVTNCSGTKCGLPKNPVSLLECGAGERSRTFTTLRSADFNSNSERYRSVRLLLASHLVP